ncbi:MAG: type III-A CRISPR-associated protein Cas10/Csm1 [Candidatus Cloacimonas sp.]|jgi:CRISPR-associated protein Csm1|nr:type III-A CRISPR-associated protein Cas10/Csm1 [Candidatus Cloacimonas sp.]
MIDVYDIALAGLLHDIGKVMQRAEEPIVKTRYEMRCPSFNGVISHQHVMWSELFFAPLAEKDVYWQEIANLASSHHNASAYANPADKEKYWLIQCLIMGDRISSMWDRSPDDETNTRGTFKCKPLYSILSDVSLGSGISEADAFKIGAKQSTDDSAFPRKVDATTLKTAEYKSVYQQFKTEFNNQTTALNSGSISKVNFVDAVDSLLEKYFWSVPSNTMEKKPTNSLYYHSKITAGIACALFAYYQDKPDYRGELHNLIESEKRVLMLVGGDLSGIQSYLFDLHPEHSKKAAKTLRARSFKIKTLCDIVLQRMCRELGLARQCILMNAGGKFMLLAPNSPEVETYLSKLKTEVDKVFYHEFMGAVSLNLDWHSTIKFKDLKMDSFPETLDVFIANLEKAKLHKFSSLLRPEETWNSEAFVIRQTAYYNTLCPQCGKRTVEKDSEICDTCMNEIKLGEILPKQTHFVISKGKPKHKANITIFSEPWYLEAYKPGTKLSEDSFAFCIAEDATAKVLHYPYKPVATALPSYAELTEAQQQIIADTKADTEENDSPILSFDELAMLAMQSCEEGKYRGVPLNAVLKGDVDSLGNIFSLGLRYRSDGKKKPEGFSLTQYATLSAAMDWFFSAYLPALICTRPQYRNLVYIVYAGGDDFCLIGPWNVMLDLVILLDKQFKAFCGNHPDLHFSAALRLLHGKSPIRFAIDKTEEDLQQAKAYPNCPEQTIAHKNAIHLFDTTIPWQKMAEVMAWADKFDKWLDEAKNNEDKGFSTQFLYRLLQYNEMALRYQDKKDIRDLLYKSYLTYDLKRNFREVSEPVEKMQELAWQDEQIRYLRVPLHKTIYKNRKYTNKGGKNDARD